MSRSDELEALVVALAKAQDIPIDPRWVPEIALHLRRLFEATRILDETPLRSQELAQRFVP